MNRWLLNVPVIFIFFNREETTRNVFERIKRVRPRQLFLVSDAAREHVLGEERVVSKLRKITDEIDWECEVYTDYACENMGCDRRIVSGITKAFEKVDRAIILEDDCLPTSDFFDFCEYALNKYENEYQIGYVSGGVYIKNYKTPYSYFYSNYGSTWGWATWKSRWDKFGYESSEFEMKKNRCFKGVFPDKKQKKWVESAERYFNQGIYPWDYVWQICMGDYLKIVPAVNLVSNIGFSKQSTHTREKPKGYESKTDILRKPYLSPQEITAEEKYIKEYLRKTQSNLLDRIIGKLKCVINRG